MLFFLINNYGWRRRTSAGLVSIVFYNTFVMWPRSRCCFGTTPPGEGIVVVAPWWCGWTILVTCKSWFFSLKIANRIITVGSLGAALVAPADWFVVVEAAVMMWMNNSIDFYKTCFFQKFRQSHHHRGVCWCCSGGTVSRILCKLQHFLHVASLPLCK